MKEITTTSPEQRAMMEIGESCNGSVRLERTGNIFSFSASEFRVTYPDGYVGTIWSPPWHELDPQDEEARAAQVATEWFKAGTHKISHQGGRK